MKESDRSRTLARGLTAVGVVVRERPDGLDVVGRRPPFSGHVETEGDHRIAMAFSVLGRTPGSDIRLSESASIETSFPGFPDVLDSLAPPSTPGRGRARGG